MKHHRLIDPVHELRSEFALGRFRRRPLDFFVETHAHLRLHFGRKSHSAGHQLRDFAAAQIRRQENHGLRQVNAPVIAQRQRRLVENSQQQLPQRVAGLFDFVEQQKLIFSFSV